MEDMIHPSLHISTMTLISQIDSLIDLPRLYEYLNIDEQITYVEYADKPPKGAKLKNKKKRKKKIVQNSTKKRKYFYNQVTLHINIDKIINVKIFNNGSIQMTGLKNCNQSNIILDILTRRFYKDKIIESQTIKSMKIVMINSDFHIGFMIHRERLHRLMCEQQYYSSFEPIIYPGVNIKYYYNESKPSSNGICKCDSVCDGKGLNGNCKRITIAVFNSGSTIITGGESIKQLNTAYDFITNMIHQHKDSLEEKEETSKD